MRRLRRISFCVSFAIPSGPHLVQRILFAQLAEQCLSISQVGGVEASVNQLYEYSALQAT
jgi:hypothetical protein